ncbi:permease prefix domain 1-containing protein [Enterococcus crotali]|uniref:permease prefix domain 1-containing protein n=1 Tax=Enterococcus crotali TaxID=1453587 RepID=UPI00047231B9|nr:permease prefix domain 1-containing protein [Enterococcus crotali]
MKTIKDYIDSLFLGITETSQTKQLREDLLASAEDRYEDLKSQGKSENEAIGGVISEFGSIDELLEEMNIRQDFIDEKGFELDEITINEATVFLKIYHRAATLIGLGVMVIMLGIATLLASMEFYGEGIAEGFGVLFIFLGAAIGVPLFIISGTSITNINKKLDDRLIPIQLKSEIKKKRETFQRSYIFCMVSGVVLCILAVIPVVFFTTIYDAEYFGAACLMLIASFGVFFFIFGGVIMGSFTRILEQTYFISDDAKLGPNAKAERNSKRPIWLQTLEKIYWPIVTAIFLLQGFLLGNWGTGWTIFPVAGIAFWIIESIFTNNE